MNEILRDQLLDRRHRLSSATMHRADDHVRLLSLLAEVDSALERMDHGTFGLCAKCHDPIEPDRLLADPTTCFCLDHLTTEQQRAFEEDMEMAARIQRGLLPKPEFRPRGWEMDYHYAPAGVVSGDCCDVVPDGEGRFFFAVGDVTGKGVASSMLMSQLHAMFRTLLPLGLPLSEMMARTSRVFCESTLPTHFATLVCGIASADGEVEVCNAGHPPPLWISAAGGLQLIEATGLPVGMFCTESFHASRIRMAPGDSLLLYTDGAIEMQDAAGKDYGIPRLIKLAECNRALDPASLIATCMQDLAAFGGPHRADDLTLLAIRRSC